MDDTTLARARRAIERLSADQKIVSQGDAWGEVHHLRSAQGIGRTLDAAPALIRMAEAVAFVVDCGGPDGPWWRTEWGCVACGGAVDELNDAHSETCAALAIDAALANLAALAGDDADAGGMPRRAADGGRQAVPGADDRGVGAGRDGGAVKAQLRGTRQDAHHPYDCAPSTVQSCP